MTKVALSLVGLVFAACWFYMMTLIPNVKINDGLDVVCLISLVAIGPVTMCCLAMIIKEMK